MSPHYTRINIVKTIEKIAYLHSLDVFKVVYIDVNQMFKETRSSFKKWPLNLWISNKTIMEVGNITKAATFKSFLYLSYKSTKLLFLRQRFLIFQKTDINQWFLGVTQKYELRVSFNIFWITKNTFDLWIFLYLITPAEFCGLTLMDTWRFSKARNHLIDKLLERVSGARSP